MKGKVTTIIGVIIMILAAVTYIMFEAFVKDNSNVTAQNVVVAKATIEEGTVIHNLEEAKAYFEVKRLSSNAIVDGAIIVNATDTGDTGLLAIIKNAFSSNSATSDDLSQLVGYKITRNYATNEQILVSYLSTDTIEFAANERLFAIETSYVNSVAAEIKEGDYVDLWLITSGKDQTVSKKLIGPLKIYKLKTSDNVTITDSSSIPSIVLFKLDEETIEYISTLKNEGTIFFVKYGTTPTQEDIDNALENAIDNENEEAFEESDTTSQNAIVVNTDTAPNANSVIGDGIVPNETTNTTSETN